jgi:hypothetical protein
MDRFISVEDVIANVATIVPEADDHLRNIWKQWVYLGMKQLGPALDDIRVCDIFPEDNSFKKPDDLLVIDDIALYNQNGDEYQYTYRGPGKRIHTATEPVNSMPIDVSEDDYYIHLGTSGDVVSKATIRYFGQPLDEDGLMRIPERYLNALMFYCAFMTEVRNKGSKLGEFESLWKTERRIQRNLNRTPHPLQAKAIAKKFNSMINKVFYERF